MATFRGERFVGEQVRSILTQTLPPDELVVSDDGSDDGTLDAVQSAFDDFALASTTLRVLRNDRPAGVAANFERAIRATTHPLIALSDQDDVWHPDRLARQAEAFTASPELLLVHADAALVGGGGEPLGLLLDALEVSSEWRDLIHSGRAFELLMKRNVVTGATVMIDRRLLEFTVPFPPHWVHDEWLAMVAAALGGVDLVDAPLIDYRQHGGNEIGARRLGLGGKVGRMVEAGSTRNARLLSRAAELVARFDAEPQLFSVAQRAAAREKLEHEEARSALPAGRLRRVRPILRELRTGRYARFGRGALDAARDALQPLEGPPGAAGD
jgi:glycosyltransferase involved in cell wall biosynthesis